MPRWLAAALVRSIMDLPASLSLPDALAEAECVEPSVYRYPAKRHMTSDADRQWKAEQEAMSAAHSLLADPAMVAIGLQVVRAVGIKRLVPILAIGGVALGLLAARGHAQAEEPAE